MLAQIILSYRHSRSGIGLITHRLSGKTHTHWNFRVQGNRLKGRCVRSTDGPGCDSEEPPGTGISMKRVGEGVELLEAFAGLEDPHQSGKVVYLLMEIMVVLSGCDDFVEIA
jgi:hypothetical protein